MKPALAAKTRARQFLLQALYQAQLTDTPYVEVIEPFVTDHNMKRADVDYFREVLHGIDEHEQTLLELIGRVGERAHKDLDPIEKAILLLSTYELQSRIEVPYRVVINEGIELAKSFGATDSFKYINSVLDALARELRPNG
jgi:N utilization substance protein B